MKKIQQESRILNMSEKMEKAQDKRENGGSEKRERLKQLIL